MKYPSASGPKYQVKKLSEERHTFHKNCTLFKSPVKNQESKFFQYFQQTFRICDDWQLGDKNIIIAQFLHNLCQNFKSVTT